MDIESLTSKPDEIYYTKDFFTIIESHLNWLRKSTGVTLLAPTPQQQNMYAGDMYGLFSDMRIPKKYHWVVMRLNGFHSPADYNSVATSFIIPDYKQVDRLTSVLNTKK